MAGLRVYRRGGCPIALCALVAVTMLVLAPAPARSAEVPVTVGPRNVILHAQGTIPLNVACPAGSVACNGVLTVATAEPSEPAPSEAPKTKKKGKKGKKKGKKGSKKPRVSKGTSLGPGVFMGSESFAVPAGYTIVVNVHLTPEAVSMVIAHPTVPASAQVSGSDGAGNALVGISALTIAARGVSSSAGPAPLPVRSDSIDVAVGPPRVQLLPDGTAPLNVRCAGTAGPCDGFVSLRTAERYRIGGRKSKAKRLLLGKEPFSVSPGLTLVVNVHLDSAMVGIVKRHAPLSVTARIDGTAGDGAPLSGQARLRLNPYKTGPEA